MRNNRDGLIKKGADLHGRRYAVEDRDYGFVAGNDQENIKEGREDERYNLIGRQSRGKHPGGDENHTHADRAQIAGKNQSQVRVSQDQQHNDKRQSAGKRQDGKGKNRLVFSQYNLQGLKDPVVFTYYVTRPAPLAS